MLKFYNAWWLIALVLVPLYWLFEVKYMRFFGRKPPPGTESRIAQFAFSRFSLMQRFKPRFSGWKYLYPVLRTGLILCLVIALARPRIGKGRQDIQGEGVDIVIALDISGSMLAMDFVPENRLGAAKKVAKEFVARREHDRIGLVSFSEYALTRCPLTHDHNALTQLLAQVEVNKAASSTAIGMGLATAVARLRNSTAKSKVIILITDGVNNTGEIDPFAAADMAKTFGIKVYPIGVGSNGMVDFPVDDPLFGQRYQKVMIEMDMQALNKIADLTGTGSASLATSTEQLKELMNKIDRMEKSRYKIRYYYDYSEIFPFFLWIAWVFLLLELVFRLIIIKVLPE